MTLYLDHTHLGRHVTGIERITQELFSAEALAPLAVTPVTAGGTLSMIMTQTFGLAARLARDPAAALLCPGFPPSPLLYPFRQRVVPYIHDLFLITRWQDLNGRAKLYMSLPFSMAIHSFRWFLANSEDTARKLAAHARADARITVYRPRVRNVFGLTTGDRPARPAGGLRLVSLGTVEPRKNFVAASRILAALRETGHPDARLDIVGRRGWGDDWSALEGQPGVTLHGYQTSEAARAIIERADAFVCTSHEEGLGLPLLEAQYAGLPVIVPDQAVFKEVLGQSPIFVDPGDAAGAAQAIAAVLGEEGWRSRYCDLAARNLDRWNTLAAADRRNVIGELSTFLASHGSRRRADSPGRLTDSARERH